MLRHLHLPYFALSCAAVLASVMGCDDTQYNTVNIEAMGNDAGADVLPGSDNQPEDVRPRVDVESEPDDVDAGLGGVACNSQAQWTALAPAPERVERHVSKLFPVQSAAPYGAAIVYWPLSSASDDPPARPVVWFPSEEDREQDGFVELDLEQPLPNEVSAFPAMDLKPMDNTAFAGQYFATAYSVDGTCGALRLQAGVVEAQPGTWPRLNTSLTELIRNAFPESFFPERQLPDDAARCEVQGLALTRRSGGNSLAIKLALLLDKQPTEAVVVQVLVDLNFTPDEQTLTWFGKFDSIPNELGRVERMRNFKGFNSPGGRWMSAELEYEFGRRFVTTEMGSSSVWTSNELERAEQVLAGIFNLGGEQLSMVYDNERVSVRALQGFDEVSSFTLPVGHGFWASRSSAGGPVSFVGLQQHTRLGDDWVFYHAEAVLRVGQAISATEATPLYRLEDRTGLEQLEVVFNDVGEAMIYAETVQQGAAERLIRRGEFISGPSCQ